MTQKTKSYYFHNRDKLHRAERAVKAAGKDPLLEEDLVLEEYKKLGGKYEALAKPEPKKVVTKKKAKKK